ncbi:MAG TPA: hypothetical protein IAD32_03365 [Candidatus Scatavimonas merdigallinarum]|uniref:Magnesium transporter CorA family protein n=1 Tax=Candidatus Scatavimonas merdigallinarum TaxID=2840914 RepID=A0A9D0ZJ49_9FIRM|nr:CorA family divalent cation transporter [Acutalibacteraceae bacterium]HIQ80309.1 hypothetical protein [Candidatus Scatavimonas merdigallinarum]
MCTEKEKSRFAFTVNAYYTIGPGIERTESFTPSDGALLVAIVDEAGFSSLQKQESLPTALLHKDKNIRLTRLLKLENCLLCTLNIPLKRDKLRQRAKLTVIIQQKRVVIVVHNTQAQKLLNAFFLDPAAGSISCERFLYEFFESFLGNDLLFLEEMEKHLGILEDDILGGKITNCDRKIIPLKRELMYLHSYYAQLLDLFVKLQNNDHTYFTEVALFQLLYEQADLLFDISQMLREYTVQIRELYQTQIDIKQNKTMKLLTGIATIFLPLTVITGWYGMNFVNMPELKWSFGYPMVFIVSLVISLVCIYIFKKKNYF